MNFWSWKRLFIILTRALLMFGGVVWGFNLVNPPMHLSMTNGDSMEPFFYDGDWALCVEEQVVSLGDVVAFCHPKKSDECDLVGHRVFATYEDGLITKGDNNPAPDGWLVNRSDVKCKIIGKLWDSNSSRLFPNG